MAEEGFNKLWEGEDDVEVVIRHRNKKFLRADVDKERDIDWKGVRGGGKAKWKVTKSEDNEGCFVFKNTKTDKCLRINKRMELDCKFPKAGPKAQWKVIPISKGFFLLETNDEHEERKRYCGNIKGKAMPLRIYVQGESDKFSTSWDKGGKNKETVIIAHSGMKNLKDRKDDVRANGENGKAAQWKLFLEDDDCVRFKSKGDGFLRIKGNGDVDCDGNKNGGQTIFKMIKCFEGDADFQHIIYLQSVKHENFIGVNEEGKVVKFDEKCDECRLVLFTEDEEEE